MAQRQEELMNQPTQTGGTTGTCLPAHWKDLTQQPTNQPVRVLNTHSTATKHNTPQNAEALSFKRQENRKEHPIAQNHFSTLDTGPNGQMDGKREEG